MEFLGLPKELFLEPFSNLSLRVADLEAMDIFQVLTDLN